MEKIDWDNAPEWADKYGVAGPQALRCWYSDKRYAYISDPKEIFFFGNFDTFSRHIKDFTIIDERPSPSWSGEGLPPVGVACEFSSAGHHDGFQWCIFHGLLSCGGYIIEFHHSTAPDRVTCDAFDPATTKFRPIRTPEQIAADEREAAVAAMLELDPYLPNTTLGMMSRADFCRTLHDAGYRKQEQPK